MRILVVDDEVVALNSVRRLLKRRGFSNVEICENGQDAISRIKNTMKKFLPKEYVNCEF